jgi:signal transduction histidine kinase
MKTLSLEDKTAISNEWLALENSDQQNYNAIIQIFSIAAIIIGAILIWAFSLRREIKRRQIVEKELFKSQEAAETANKVKSTFLANMSHEIRTPLNSIIGFTELVKSEVYGKVEGDKNKEYLEIVETSSHHLLALINDILDLSKVAAGQVEIYHEFMEVEREITKCVSTVKQLATNKSLIIDTQLEDIEIESDVKLFTQILINVLSNAIKFTPENGKVTIKNYNVGEELIVEIIDTGIGMDEEEIEIALSQFGQVQTAYTREHDGTGLGLPLVKKFMKALGGHLEIKSKKDVGTKIFLFFPNSQNN